MTLWTRTAGTHWTPYIIEKNDIVVRHGEWLITGYDAVDPGKPTDGELFELVDVLLEEVGLIGEENLLVRLPEFDYDCSYG